MEVAVFTVGPTGKLEWVKVAMVLAERRMESLKEGVVTVVPTWHNCAALHIFMKNCKLFLIISAW